MSAVADIAISDLSREGYCVLRGALDPAIIGALAADLAPAFALTPMCREAVWIIEPCDEKSATARAKGLPATC